MCVIVSCPINNSNPHIQGQIIGIGYSITSRLQPVNPRRCGNGSNKQKLRTNTPHHQKVMGRRYRPIKTNSNEFAVDVHVRIDDIHFPHYDDRNDVDETAVGHNNHARHFQNIRAVGNRNGGPENCFRFRTHCLRWTGLVQMSIDGIITVACIRLVGVC